MSTLHPNYNGPDSKMFWISDTDPKLLYTTIQNLEDAIERKNKRIKSLTRKITELKRAKSNRKKSTK